LLGLSLALWALETFPFSSTETTMATVTGVLGRTGRVPVFGIVGGCVYKGFTLWSGCGGSVTTDARNCVSVRSRPS
jgi:hypothetical protein